MSGGGTANGNRNSGYRPENIGQRLGLKPGLFTRIQKKSHRLR